MKPTKRKKISIKHSVQAAPPIFWTMLKRDHSKKKFTTFADEIEALYLKMRLNSEYGYIATPAMTKFYSGA